MKILSKRKAIILTVVISLIIIVLAVKLFLDSSYKDQIPVMPDSASLSESSKEQLSIAIKKARRNPTSRNLGHLGMIFHSGAFYDQATICYRLASGRDKTEWTWDYYSGYLNQEMGDSKASIVNFNSVIKADKKNWLAWYYLGKAYQKMGSDNLAEAAFNRIASLQDNAFNAITARVNYSPLPVSARFELARIYLNSNRVDEAEKVLNDVIQRYHTIGPVYRLLGNVYSVKGDSLLSRKNIIRASDLAEVTTINDTLADRLAILSRSELYLPKQIDVAIKTANPEWALELLNNALKYIPEDKYLASKAIKFFLRMNSGNEALPYLKKNLNDFRDNFNEMRDNADLLYKRGFYEQAIPYFKQMTILKPEYLELHLDYALCYWKLEKKDSASAIMNKLYENNPGNPKVLSDEVEFMINTLQTEKAKSFLALLTRAAPSDLKVPKLAGMIAENEGDIMTAINLYEKAAKSDPSDILTTQRLGTLLLDQKMWSRAVSLLKSSLALHPNEPFLLERLGSLFVSCPDEKQRNLKEGMELSERAFFHISSTSGTMISAGKNLAQGYAVLGNFQSATYFMGITLRMAQSNNLPLDYIEGLQKLASKIQYFSQKK